jgi:predicted  nucleic acid-binding Zn-ribbon protein
VSDSARPEKAAFKELESLVRHLGEELSGFRRRALQAEARLKEIDTAATSGKPTPERLAALERENKDLTRRLKAATERVNGMLERVRFLREQSEAMQ